MTNPAAWHPDPLGRHQLRYWDGGRWTEHVSNHGRPSIDAAGLAPVEAAPVTSQNWSPPAQPAGPSPFHTTVLDPSRAEYRVQMVGAGDRLYSLAELQHMARSKALKSTTLVQRVSENFAVPASSLPGVFSDKTLVVAAILSWTLGIFGVDRFYLGYKGIGIAKLLTLGGCGVWALIDFIMIVTRSVPDSDGRPLS